MPNAKTVFRETPRESASSLDTLIDEALLDRTFPGIACGLWIDGRQEYVRYAGFSDPDEDETDGNAPISENTLFDAASLTKPLATSLLVLKACEAGAIDLNGTLGQYLPRANPLARDIPIHSLLTHTSGLPAIPSIEGRFPSPLLIDREAAILELYSIQPERGHGEAVVYSCTGYLLLGLILEKISGRLLGDLYGTEVAGPLHLPRAAFAPGIGPNGEPLGIEGAAATEYCEWRKKRVRGQVHDESAYCFGGHAGNAGLFVSLEDVYRTASILLEGGVSGGKRFLGENLIRDLTEDKTPNLGERRSFGFRMKEPGTFTGQLWPSSSFGHTGFTGTSLAVSPRQGLTAIILTNRVYYGRNDTTQKIADFRTRFHTIAFRSFY